MEARSRRLCITSVAVMTLTDSARCLTLLIPEARVLISELMENEVIEARTAWGSNNEDGR